MVFNTSRGGGCWIFVKLLWNICWIFVVYHSHAKSHLFSRWTVSLTNLLVNATSCLCWMAGYPLVPIIKFKNYFFNHLFRHWPGIHPGYIRLCFWKWVASPCYHSYVLTMWALAGCRSFVVSRFRYGVGGLLLHDQIVPFQPLSLKLIPNISFEYFRSPRILFKNCTGITSLFVHIPAMPLVYQWYIPISNSAKTSSVIWKPVITAFLHFFDLFL